MAKSPRVPIEDMLSAIRQIGAKRATLTYERFADSSWDRAAMERMVEIVSEASRRIPEELKATEPDIPWRAIAGIGNKLRHDYDEVAPALIWRVAVHDLPDLEAALQRMLTRCPEDDEEIPRPRLP